MSKNMIRYEDDSQDNQEMEFNQECDYGEENDKKSELLVLAEMLGEVVGIDNIELLSKTIIKAVKKGKRERFGRNNPYSIMYEGRIKIIAIYREKEGVGIIPLNQDIIRQIREYC